MQPLGQGRWAAIQQASAHVRRLRRTGARGPVLLRVRRREPRRLHHWVAEGRGPPPQFDAVRGSVRRGDHRLEAVEFPVRVVPAGVLTALPKPWSHKSPVGDTVEFGFRITNYDPRVGLLTHGVGSPPGLPFARAPSGTQTTGCRRCPTCARAVRSPSAPTATSRSISVASSAARSGPTPPAWLKQVNCCSAS